MLYRTNLYYFYLVKQLLVSDEVMKKDLLFFQNS
jgi:hypothetical protein